MQFVVVFACGGGGCAVGCVGGAGEGFAVRHGFAVDVAEG